MSSSWLTGLGNTVSAWQSLFALSGLDSYWSSIIFYAESNADWAHIAPIVQILNEEYQQPVTCITSDPADSILKSHHKLVRPFFIGSGIARTVFFQMARAKAFVMTLTDLDSYYLKRSKNDVHYFYVFHALVSSHGAYREHAFDAYDTVFCVGPHHVSEIREQEKVYHLKAKNLVEAGYCRLDQVFACAANQSLDSHRINLENPVVLLAPTWGPSSMVNNCLDSVIKTLTAAKITTILRLHPMTLRHHPELPDRLVADYADSGCFSFDSSLQAIDSLLQADIMVADHGGSGLEFALGLERPVVSIATPAKIHNTGRDRIALPLFEDQIRDEMGVRLDPDELDKLPGIVKELHAKSAEWRSRLAQTRQSNIFNVGKSAQVMADYIYDFVAGSQKGKPL
ncbi:MAG: CDP-glycerol:poly(glycerophosphate) glycerophosphotransferase [uncultured bacterium]|nr:MAG: CDP-glycerol:poly(glycerophosphate) glycerophosphotransferase [uncultured bacterium]